MAEPMTAAEAAEKYPMLTKNKDTAETRKLIKNFFLSTDDHGYGIGKWNTREARLDNIYADELETILDLMLGIDQKQMEEERQAMVAEMLGA